MYIYIYTYIDTYIHTQTYNIYIYIYTLAHIILIWHSDLSKPGTQEAQQARFAKASSIICPVLTASGVVPVRPRIGGILGS